MTLRERVAEKICRWDAKKRIQSFRFPLALELADQILELLQPQVSVEELVKFIQELADSNEIFTIRKLASALSKLYQGEVLEKIDAECPKCHLQNIIFDYHKPPMNCRYCGAVLEVKPAQEAEVPEEIDKLMLRFENTLRKTKIYISAYDIGAIKELEQFRKDWETINALIRWAKKGEQGRCQCSGQPNSTTGECVRDAYHDKG